MRNLFIILIMILTAQAAAADLNTQLIAAVMQGKVDQARDLIVQGGDVNAKNPAGRPVIVLAAANGNTRTVQSLISSGADINAVDGQGNSALMEAAAFGHEDVVNLLIASGADVNLSNAGGEAALKKANRAGHAKIEELLTSAGAGAAAEEGKQTGLNILFSRIIKSVDWKLGFILWVSMILLSAGVNILLEYRQVESIARAQAEAIVD